LLHRLKNYGAVFLIDGINVGFCSGELKISELKDIEYKLDNFVSSTHELNLKSIFEFFKDLGIKTKIYVAGIEVQDTSFGEGLSETLKQKKEDIIKEIISFIEKTFL